jgi:hypothetical protein
VTALLEQHKEHKRQVVQDTTTEMQRWAEAFRKQVTAASNAQVKLTVLSNSELSRLTVRRLSDAVRSGCG